MIGPSGRAGWPLHFGSFFSFTLFKMVFEPVYLEMHHLANDIDLFTKTPVDVSELCLYVF